MSYDECVYLPLSHRMSISGLMMIGALAVESFKRSPLRIWFIVFLLTLACLLIAYPNHVNSDVAMYLQIGGRVLEGQIPYIDYREINLPVIHYLSTLPVIVSQVTGINLLLALQISMATLIGLTTLTSAWLLSRDEELRDSPDTWFMIPCITIGFAFIALCLTLFGQREHVFSLVVIPWYVLRWRRWRGQILPTLAAFIIGICAAIGTSLKPHFILIVLVPELYWLLRHRRFRAFLTPEVYGVIVTMLIYATYILTHWNAFSVYIREILPELVAGYDAYGHYTFLEALTNPLTLFGLTICILPWIWHTSSDVPLWDMARPLSLMAVAGCAIFIVQAKGMFYHRIPFDYFTLLVSGLAAYTAAHARIRRHQRTQAWAWGLGLLVWILLTGFTSYVLNLSQPDAQETALETAIRTYVASGDTILFVDDGVYPAHPLLERIGVHQVGTYFPDYPLRIGYYGWGEGQIFDPGIRPPETVGRYLETLATDIREYEPKLIVIRTNDRYGIGDLAHFLETRGFLETSVSPLYSLIGEVAGFRIYSRKS